MFIIIIYLVGVIRSLHAMGRLEHVYCTETRPYNQGARLTAYELVYEQIPATLIADSMASVTMKEKRVSGECFCKLIFLLSCFHAGLTLFAPAIYYGRLGLVINLIHSHVAVGLVSADCVDV